MREEKEGDWEIGFEGFSLERSGRKSESKREGRRTKRDLKEEEGSRRGPQWS